MVLVYIIKSFWTVLKDFRGFLPSGFRGILGAFLGSFWHNIVVGFGEIFRVFWGDFFGISGGF